MDTEIFKCFVAVIVVTEREEAGVRAHIRDFNKISVENDDQIYYESFFERDGEKKRIIMAKQNEMGMTAAAVLCTKLIEEFRPKYLIMTGIAAGIADAKDEKQYYGDVVVADMVWNYASGKFVNPEQAEIRIGEVGFIPRPEVVNMNHQLNQYIEKAIASMDNQCHVYIGPMACGTNVVANREIIEKQVRSQINRTAAVDMESYAVAYAAQNATKPRPEALVIKSVCDYGDARKCDYYQKFAAYTSFEFAKLLYEHYLP